MILKGFIFIILSYHRYNFKSTVIKGELIEEMYQLTNSDKNDWVLYNESFSKERGISNNIKIDVSVKSLGINYQRGVYHRFFYDFHKVGFNENTITLLNRTPIITDYAQVIRHKSLDKICPFSKVLSEEELWEYVEDTIKN